ncbi:hypothetical protein M8J77_003877 [Diaphorina citri]|nr:hypothetical protein M8J77_003877 [Diaphorina citri]
MGPISKTHIWALTLSIILCTKLTQSSIPQYQASSIPQDQDSSIPQSRDQYLEYLNAKCNGGNDANGRQSYFSSYCFQYNTLSNIHYLLSFGEELLQIGPIDLIYLKSDLGSMHSQDDEPPLLIYPEHSGEHIQPSQDSGSHTLQENLRQRNNDLDVIGNDVHVVERGRQNRPRHAKTSGATVYEHPRAAKSGRAFHNNTKREIGNQAFQKRAIPLQDFHKNMETPQTFQERDIPLQAFQKRGVEKPQAFRKREIPHKRDIRSGGSGEHSPDSNYYVEDTNTDHKRTIDIDNGSPSDIRNIDYYYTSGEVNSNGVMQDEEEYDDGEDQEDLAEEVETLLDLKRTGPKARTGGIKGIDGGDTNNYGTTKKATKPDEANDVRSEHREEFKVLTTNSVGNKTNTTAVGNNIPHIGSVASDGNLPDDGIGRNDLLNVKGLPESRSLKGQDKEMRNKIEILKMEEEKYFLNDDHDEEVEDSSSTEDLDMAESLLTPSVNLSPLFRPIQDPNSNPLHPIHSNSNQHHPTNQNSNQHHPTNQNSNQHYPTNQNSNQHYPTNQNSNTYPILERSNQPEDFQPMEARDGESNLNATNETRHGEPIGSEISSDTRTNRTDGGGQGSRLSELHTRQPDMIYENGQEITTELPNSKKAIDAGNPADLSSTSWLGNLDEIATRLNDIVSTYGITIPIPDWSDSLPAIIPLEERERGGVKDQSMSRRRTHKHNSKKYMALFPLVAVLKFMVIKALLVPLLISVLIIKKIIILGVIALPYVFSLLRICRNGPGFGLLFGGGGGGGGLGGNQVAANAPYLSAVDTAVDYTAGYGTHAGYKDFGGGARWIDRHYPNMMGMGKMTGEVGLIERK